MEVDLLRNVELRRVSSSVVFFSSASGWSDLGATGFNRKRDYLIFYSTPVESSQHTREMDDIGITIEF